MRKRTISLLLAMCVTTTTLFAGTLPAQADEAPQLSLETPSDNLYVKVPDVQVSGETNGDSLAAVSGGVETTARVGDDGGFAVNVALREGANTILVVSARGGVETTLTRRVTLDSIPPRMTSGIASRIVFPSIGAKSKAIAKVTLSEPGPLVSVITNRKGKWLRILSRSWVRGGRHTIKWNGRLRRGRLAAPGTYRLYLASRDRSWNRVSLRKSFKLVIQDTRAQRVVKTALKYLGVRYAWGGMSPRGFDCSGLVGYAYRVNGISLPRTSRSMAGAGVRVSRKSLRPGDILLFNTNGSGISHAALYMGRGRFVQASSGAGHVNISRFTSYYSSRFVMARRVLR